MGRMDWNSGGMLEMPPGDDLTIAVVSGDINGFVRRAKKAFDERGLSEGVRFVISSPERNGDGSWAREDMEVLRRKVENRLPEESGCILWVLHTGPRKVSWSGWDGGMPECSLLVAADDGDAPDGGAPDSVTKMRRVDFGGLAEVAGIILDSRKTLGSVMEDLETLQEERRVISEALAERGREVKKLRAAAESFRQQARRARTLRCGLAAFAGLSVALASALLWIIAAFPSSGAFIRALQSAWPISLLVRLLGGGG